MIVELEHEPTFKIAGLTEPEIETLTRILEDFINLRKNEPNPVHVGWVSYARTLRNKLYDILGESWERY